MEAGAHARSKDEAVLVGPAGVVAAAAALAALLSAEAVHAAPKERQPEEIRLLSDVLADPRQDSPVKLKAIRALGRKGSPAIPALAGVVQNDFLDFSFRLAAIRALACTGKGSIPVLKSAIDSVTRYKDAPSPEAVIVAAIQALKYAGPEAAPILISIVHNTSDNDSQEAAKLHEAVKALGYTGGSGVLGVLQEVVDNPNLSALTKGAAVEAVGRLGMKTFNPCELEQMREGMDYGTK